MTTDMRMSELPADFVHQLHTLLGADLHSDSASLQVQAGDNSWREQLPALVACADALPRPIWAASALRA